jgi:DNA-binding GntR family transcriptional regulator
MRGENNDQLAGLGQLEINRASTAEHAAEALRTIIMSGQLPQGQPLREMSLSASLGVSRNTVREAIRVLAREGLVTHSPHKGAVVTRLTRHDVADLFRVRRSLELAGVAMLPQASDQNLAPLIEDVDALEIAAARPGWAAVIDADRRFHKHLVDLLGSRRLSRFYDAIQAELRLCMSIVDRRDEEREPLVAEHRELLELILARAVARCTEVMLSHLDESEQMLLAVMPDDEATPPTPAAKDAQ